jgi:hypothetical protein
MMYVMARAAVVAVGWIAGATGCANVPVVTQPHQRNPLSAKQVRQRNRGYGMFIHFGINTFNETEWSDGTLPVASYHPTSLDPGQWVRVARDAGFRYVILVVRAWTRVHAAAPPRIAHLAAGARESRGLRAVYKLP